MSAVNDGGPAFPIPYVDVDMNATTVKIGASGMSIRDWFAGMALANMAREGTHYHASIAEEAYEYSDAMLKAREVSNV